MSMVRFSPHVVSAHGVADRVLDVIVGYAVVPGRLVDPHLDNIACLPKSAKQC